MSVAVVAIEVLLGAHLDNFLWWAVIRLAALLTPDLVCVWPSPKFSSVTCVKVHTETETHSHHKCIIPDNTKHTHW